MPELIFHENKFILRCTYEQRGLAKENGFRWNQNPPFWFTQDLKAAARLKDFAIGRAQTILGQVLLKQKPWIASLPSPPTLFNHYYQYQQDAVRFALERNNSYLALEPGLGKTLCAAMIAKTHARTVYLTPPFLLKNIEAEFKQWAPEIEIWNLKDQLQDSLLANKTVLLVPDSLITRASTFTAIFEFLQGSKDSALIVDEAHRFKNDMAKRTKAVLGTRTKAPPLLSLFSRRVFMSGTPMPNRPIELFPVLAALAPETIGFMNKFAYGQRYCGLHQNQYGWDFTGATNVPELAKRILGPFMLRVRKKDVLNLPPKTEEIFVLNGNQPAQLFEAGQKIGMRYADTEDLIKDMIASAKKMDPNELPIASYRRLLGAEKVELAAEFIQNILDDTDENVLVFAYHKEVVRKLEAQLEKFSPSVITGETAVKLRQDIVDYFQTDPSARLLIGNYHAMGVGFTLTKATRVVFVEFDWVPGVNEQAADRVHRIGQDKSVLIQYLVFKDSLDKLVIETLLHKRKVIKHI